MDKDSVTALGMIGAWAQDTEAFMLDRIISSHTGEISLSKSEASNIVEALNRLQEGLAAVLNENA